MSMKASGEKWRVEIGGTAYYFDSCRVACSGGIADIPLVDGGLYRRLSRPPIYEITLTARVPQGSLANWQTLLKTGAAVSQTLRIGSMLFGDGRLRQGYFRSAEGRNDAEVTLIFSATEV